MNWARRNVFEVLDVLKFVGIFLLVLMFIHFNSAIARQTQETQQIAASTNRVVKSQDDILQAIKKVTQDTQLTAQQQTKIIICMLQVPVAERTTDTANSCRNQAALPSSTPSDNSPKTTKSSSSSTPENVNKTDSPTPTSSTPSSPPQPSTIQKVINKVKGLL